MFESESGVNSTNTECDEPQAQGIRNSPNSAQQAQSRTSNCQMQERIESDEDVADGGSGMYLLN